MSPLPIPSVMIPCAGEAGRWGLHLGVPKQLAPIGPGGEPLLARTIRLLRANGVREIHVLTHNPTIRSSVRDAVSVLPPERTYLADTIRTTRSLWGARNLILLGDVYLSEPTIRNLVFQDRPIEFFGVMADSPQVKLQGGRPELFALRFDASEAGRLYRTLALNSLLAALRDLERAPCFWNIRRLRMLAGPEPLRLDSGCSRARIIESFFRYGFRHDPPERLARRGFRRNRFWHWVRRLRAWTPDCTRNFGKLWGAYMLLAEQDHTRGLIGDGPAARAPLFSEIPDYAQDFDTASDYQRLQKYLTPDATGQASG
jgi:hypothetical protein